MIQTTNISKMHFVNSIAPDYYIVLDPFGKDRIEETDVTCVFSMPSNGYPEVIKCIGIEYFDKINYDTLLTIKFGNLLPTKVYLFKGKPFDIELERKRLIK